MGDHGSEPIDVTNRSHRIAWVVNHQCRCFDGTARIDNVFACKDRKVVLKSAMTGAMSHCCQRRFAEPQYGRIINEFRVTVTRFHFEELSDIHPRQLKSVEFEKNFAQPGALEKWQGPSAARWQPLLVVPAMKLRAQEN